jgi:stearoyl-CoA desaturase (delta-9 desaturase)
MLDGILNLSLWGYIAAALILTHITIASVTIFLHRHQAHRALDMHPIVSHFFRFWLWMTTGMKTKEWVAIHRKHHSKCETEEDPHSPQVLGIKKVLWQGAELYRQEANNNDTLDRYGKGTPDDWMERNIYRYTFLGIALMFAIDLALFGLAGITIWAVQMVWIPFWAAGVINGVGHFWGYRNYECADASTNIVPWGIIIGGEELHNNHHTFPGSAKLSSKWWEFDIGWFYIRLLQSIGLAKVKKVAPTPVIGPSKPVADMETLRAVLANRFQVMSNYYKDVLMPVCKEELNRANASKRNLLKRIHKIIARDDSLLAEEEKQQLENALKISGTLRTVYRHKQQLQAIWKRSSSNNENLLHALQEWCKQAEEAGIQALEDFAANLRGYAQKTA